MCGTWRAVISCARCNAIDYAHSRGVLHRDIKPSNVIVGKHGETLVVDWGLAKPLGRAEPGADPDERTLMPSSASGSAETIPGSAMGTPAYMSPEQAVGDLDRLEPRSDVYSLGATLYCLLTGKAPFEGDVGEVLRKVARGDFPPPRQVDPSIDPALEAVCLKAMATKPEDRFACLPAARRGPRALHGRRAGDGLARAVRPPGAAVGAAAPDPGRGRGDHGACRSGRDGGRPGGPDSGQPGTEGGQHRPGGVQRPRAGSLRPGARGDPDLSHRRQRGCAPEAGRVQVVADQAA